jgi:hypothetical protein
MTTRKPKLAGVPAWRTDRWLAKLKEGRLDAFGQRELYEVLLHKWSGKRGVPALPSAKSVRRIRATFLEYKVRKEIWRMQAEGPPPRRHGGYREQALDTVAEAVGWPSGAALAKYIRRNRGGHRSRGSVS